MIIDCQLKSLLKNYLKTLIVGFGQADALGLTVDSPNPIRHDSLGTYGTLPY